MHTRGRTRLVFSILLLSATQVFGASPDGDKRAKERLHFTQYLEEMKRKEPSKYDALQTQLTFRAEFLLARLGYGTGPVKGALDENFRKALKRYESNRGIPVTGDPLALETMEKIQSDTKLLDSAPIELPKFSLSLGTWDNGWVFATGTWTLIGGQLAPPEQTSDISCSKAAGTCTMTTSSVRDGFGNRRIVVETYFFEIERWDDHEIVTKPSQAICNRLVYRINRTQKSVSGLRTTIKTTGICEGISNADMNLALVDGWELSGSLDKEYRRNVDRLMQISPDSLEKLRTSRE